MKHNINSSIGFKIEATDGDLGEVTDFYFDDKTWTIRYLIVKAGSGKKVLISPQAVLNDASADGKFKVNLTTEQIRTSPDIDTDMPVSRQQREVLHRHHAWENFWESQIFSGGYHGDTVASEDLVQENSPAVYDLHLQSAKAVSGYTIHASDGEIGHLNNYLIDDQTWQLTDLVIDTHNWIGGKKVLVDVSHVEGVDWHNFELFLNITKAEIENSPEFIKA